MSPLPVLVPPGFPAERTELEPDVVQVDLAEEEQRALIRRHGFEHRARDGLAARRLGEEGGEQRRTGGARGQRLLLVAALGQQVLELEEQRRRAKLDRGQVLGIRHAQLERRLRRIRVARVEEGPLRVRQLPAVRGQTGDGAGHHRRDDQKSAHPIMFARSGFGVCSLLDRSARVSRRSLNAEGHLHHEFSNACPRPPRAFAVDGGGHESEPRVVPGLSTWRRPRVGGGAGRRGGVDGHRHPSTAGADAGPRVAAVALVQSIDDRADRTDPAGYLQLLHRSATPRRRGLRPGAHRRPDRRRHGRRDLADLRRAGENGCEADRRRNDEHR